MKTDDLITMIANQAGPAPKVSVVNRLVPAGIVGGLIAAAIVLGVLGLIPGTMFAETGPWIKIGYAGTLVIAAGWLFARLGKLRNTSLPRHEAPTTGPTFPEKAPNMPLLYVPILFTFLN